MILTCPECSTRFVIDPAVLGGEGRTVRCSKCENIWVQTPPEDAVAPPPVERAPEPEVPESGAPEPEPEPEPAPQEPFDISAGRRPRRSATAANAGGGRPGRAAAIVWTLLAVAVAGVLGGAYLWRDAVIRAWPAAQVLYQMAGLQADPPGTGLGLRNVSWKAGVRDGARVLTVEGEVANVSEDVRAVPKIQAILFDNTNRELQRWTFAAPESRLLPGENVSFTTELENPAEGAKRLTIVFAGSR